jgi:hypothetical protein
VIPRSRRAREAISIIRRRSKLFKVAVAEGDGAKMEAISTAAWDALTNLFETLRNECDHRYLDPVHLQNQVGFLIQPATPLDQSEMAAAFKLDRSHMNCRALSLHHALNKLGHYDSAISTYRIDGRGAHYLLLGGRQKQENWVAEILVSRLCKEASSAARAIRQFPMP